ncbi:hypothetical protein AAU57_03355 [Nonlabens sp. YIK11]|nr:hypothetical protein AAU57_03355 [Nonlabens sp. YIK11]
MKCHLILFLLISFLSFSQESQTDHIYYDSVNLQVGYQFSFEGPNKRNYHLLEIGVNKLHYGGRHGGGFQYGIGSEIGLNTEDFLLGPKIGGVIYYQFVVLGSELVTYTNFDSWTLRYVPIIGLGGNGYSLTIKPQVILTNKNFNPINKVSVQLSASISLWKEKTHR